MIALDGPLRWWYPPLGRAPAGHPQRGTVEIWTAEQVRRLIRRGTVSDWRIWRSVRYVCFEGSLGAHLKLEVKKKIWKSEYGDILSLLSLKKCNLDRGKSDDSKKE